MFVCNLNLNSNKIMKTILIILLIIVLLICTVIAYNIFGKNNFSVKNDNCLVPGNVCEIDSKNYTNVLNEVHNNIDSYIGKKIKFSGYVYRVYDFSLDQFVLARNMVISSDFQTVVVGFLCSSKSSKDFADNTWVEIEGTITKGVYHEEIPIIQITRINEIEKPQDEYVYPPDNAFIPTSSII